MEINFEKIKEQYEKEIRDIMKLDTPKNQKTNLQDLSVAARVMWMPLQLLAKEQAFELKGMVDEADKRIK